jgi:hypothetical protein
MPTTRVATRVVFKDVQVRPFGRLVLSIGFFLQPIMAVKVAANFALEANTAESKGLDFIFRPSPKKNLWPVLSLSSEFGNVLGVGGGGGGGSGFAKPYDRLGGMFRAV